MKLKNKFPCRTMQEWPVGNENNIKNKELMYWLHFKVKAKSVKVKHQ